MSHGHTGPVALVVAAVLAATAGHCATAAMRGGGGVPRRLADVNHAVMGAAMALMAASSLLPDTGPAPTSSGGILLFALLAALWAAVGVRELPRHGDVDRRAACGTHPGHLVVVNGAMAVMLVPTAGAQPAPVLAEHPAAHGATAAGTTIHAATPTTGSVGAIVLVAFVLGVYFVVHAVLTLTASGAPRGRRLPQVVMSVAMAGMLLTS